MYSWLKLRARQPVGSMSEEQEVIDLPAGKTARQKINTVIFFAVLIAVTGGCFALAIKSDFEFYEHSKYYALASRKWPTTIGTVADSNVGFEFGWGRSSLSHYVPHVKYQYSVNGKTYTGDQISFPNPKYLNNVDADRVRDQYQKSSEVEVFYDPKDPSKSCLINGLTEHLTNRIPWRIDDHSHDPN